MGSVINWTFNSLNHMNPFHFDADPDPGSALKINGSESRFSIFLQDLGFLNKGKVKHFSSFLFRFLLKLSEPVRNVEIS